jgi:hypothetical protein
MLFVQFQLLLQYLEVDSAYFHLGLQIGDLVNFFTNAIRLAVYSDELPPGKQLL